MKGLFFEKVTLKEIGVIDCCIIISGKSHYDLEEKLKLFLYNFQFIDLGKTQSFPSTAVMHNIRPAGQMLPAKTLNLAR